MKASRRLKRKLKRKNFKKDFAKVKEEINSIIARVARVDRTEIREDINIRDNLGIESLDAMEILAAIEARFNITINTAKAFRVVIVEDLYDLAKEYLKKNYYRKKR